MDASYILDENKYKICYIVNEMDLITENNNGNTENAENNDNPENLENVTTSGASNMKSNTADQTQNELKTGSSPNDLSIELEEEHDIKHLYKFTPKKYEVIFQYYYNYNIFKYY